MCRQSAMKQLDVQYNVMMENIKKSMSDDRYFCTTADIWSATHRSFVGYTCHWLTENFERNSVALACRRMFGTRSAENIRQIISEIQHTFGLNASNVIYTVTDNGSNFVKAFNHFGVGDPDEEDSGDDLPVFKNDVLPKHQLCASHTVNLLATTDFNKILRSREEVHIQNELVMKKCSVLWKKCNWPKSSEIIVSTLGSALLVPVVTRWNSLYDAIQKLLQHKAKLDELCDNLAVPFFTSGDIKYLEWYQMLMEPIAQTLNFLQGEDVVKYCCLLPSLLSLSNKL